MFKANFKSALRCNDSALDNLPIKYSNWQNMANYSQYPENTHVNLVAFLSQLLPFTKYGKVKVIQFNQHSAPIVRHT